MKNTANKKPQVFLDTNVLIDVAMFRGKEALAIEYIVDSSMDNSCDLHIAAHSLTNMYYILRTALSEEERKQLILNYCATCKIESINRDRIECAIDNGYAKDLEDALQIQCAIESNCDYFVTRDRELFKKCPIKTLFPHELIRELSL